MFGKAYGTLPDEPSVEDWDRFWASMTNEEALSFQRWQDEGVRTDPVREKQFADDVEQALREEGGSPN